MAEPFEEPLPGLGDVPWNLNPAVDEVRSRISQVNDTIDTGRLSPSALYSTIAGPINSQNVGVLNGLNAFRVVNKNG